MVNSITLIIQPNYTLVNSILAMQKWKNSMGLFGRLNRNGTILIRKKNLFGTLLKSVLGMRIIIHIGTGIFVRIGMSQNEKSQSDNENLNLRMRQKISK